MGVTFFARMCAYARTPHMYTLMQYIFEFRTKVEDKYEKLDKLNKKIGEKVKQAQKNGKGDDSPPDPSGASGDLLQVMIACNADG